MLIPLLALVYLLAIYLLLTVAQRLKKLTPDSSINLSWVRFLQN